MMIRDLLGALALGGAVLLYALLAALTLGGVAALISALDCARRDMLG